MVTNRRIKHRAPENRRMMLSLEEQNMRNTETSEWNG